MGTLLMVLALGCASDRPPVPAPEKIVARMVAVTDQDNKILEQYAYRKTLTVSDVKDPRNVRIKHSEGWLVKGSSQQQIMRDGTELQGEPSKPATPDLTGAMLGRFHYRAVESEPFACIGDRLQYVLAFDPPAQVPQTKDHQQDLLYHLGGLIFVDVVDFRVASIQATLPKPYRVDTVGKILEASFFLSQRRLFGITVLNQVVMEVRYTTMDIGILRVGATVERHEYRYAY